MPDFILLMRDDERDAVADQSWGAYIAHLQASGCFQGGSAIGRGICLRKPGAEPAPLGGLTGFIRVTAVGLEAAKALVEGNPVYEAGGTVEIRELPRTD